MVPATHADVKNSCKALTIMSGTYKHYIDISYYYLTVQNEIFWY